MLMAYLANLRVSRASSGKAQSSMTSERIYRSARRPRGMLARFLSKTVHDFPIYTLKLCPVVVVLQGTLWNKYKVIIDIRITSNVQ